MSQDAARFTDLAGLPVQAASQAAVAAFDAVLDEYVVFRPTLPDRLRDLFAADPAMPLAHSVRAALLMQSGKGELRAAARDAAQQAVQVSADASRRERLHAEAVEQLVAGRNEAAVRVWEEVLALAPTDILALKLAQFAHFYNGDSRAMRRSTDRVLPAWSPDVPRYARWLGVRAFALEEAGMLSEAEAAGREAIERAPDDPWATHAVAHCLETTGRCAEGVAWITGLEPQWTGSGTMDGHLRWHRALFVLELDGPEAVLADYDAGMHAADSSEYLDLCNDVALLQRLELLGLDVGGRWEGLATRLEERRRDRMLPFCDVHWVLGLAAAGRLDSADALIEDLADRGAADTPEAATIRHAALPLARGLRAWRRGDAVQALMHIWSCQDRIHLLGGSHAQRDLFEQILAAAAATVGDTQRCRHLLRERTLLRPDDRFAASLRTH